MYDAKKIGFYLKTRLISIESQPKKVVIVVVAVVVVVFVVVCLVVGVGIVVGYCWSQKPNFRFGQNWVNDKSYIVVVVAVIVYFLLLSIQKPSFKTWSKSDHSYVYVRFVVVFLLLLI